MDTLSATALASELGTSVPRVTRAARRMGFDAGPSGRRFSFTSREAIQLRAALGVTPEAEGLSRSQIIVLAALRNAPFGLVSARALARRSGLSATAAARALASLEAMGLVERSKETIAAGRAEERTIWRTNVLHPRRPALDPVLARVKRPRAREVPRKPDRRVPPRLRHLFWNTAEGQLDVGRAGPYIARRLLRTMDIQGLAWGAGALAPGDWEAAAPARGLDAKTRRLALNLAAFDATALNRLAEPVVIAGLRVAALQDLIAMKLKVMAERGEMRDYFDVKAIDESDSVSVEEGIDLYMKRYGLAASSEALPHLYRSMGDLSDVEADESLPIDLAELQRWWSARQVRVLRNSDRFG